MPAFEAALAQHQAPRSLGDVGLRYEPSMLVGETAKPLGSLRPSLAWLSGVSALLIALVLFLIREQSLAVIATFVVCGAVGLFTASWLQRVDRRRRAFIANFATNSLRLDFTTPVAGYARTLVVHFDGVRQLDLLVQADRTHCLTVDVVPTPTSATRLREVLVANIRDDQLEAAHTLKRVLEGAFGLGDAPADSPYFSAAEEVPPGTADPTR